MKPINRHPSRSQGRRVRRPCASERISSMAELLFTFASYATRMEGDLSPLKGAERLASVLHPYGVRITWLVSPASATAMKARLTEWHEKFGDDISVCPDGMKRDHTGITPGPMVGTVEERIEEATYLRERIRQILPWTNADIVHGPHQDHTSIQALERAGFLGLWGFCWEQIEVDNITDRGCPWGFYYLDPACRTAPNTGTRGIIGMEWTARDLLKAFHSGNPCIYSTDVNDVARGGICSWREIGYLKGMFDNYYRNLRFNDLVLYQVHQEAHEMMPEFRCYSEEDCREAEEMLDELAAYVTGHTDVRTATLSEAAAIYRERYERTAPSFMLWYDTPTVPYNPDYARGTPRGPWPKTFLYYDTDCQMMFIDGKFEPVCIRNYRERKAIGRYFAEPEVPRVRLRSHSRSPYGMDLHLTVESPKAMPFGITLWEDLGPYLLTEAPGLLAHKLISQEVLFLRYDVEKGTTELKIHFYRK